MKKNKKLTIILISTSILISIILFILFLMLLVKSSRFPNYFGVAPICNLKPERALHIGNFVFPLCYRCMSIMITTIISSILVSYYFKYNKTLLIISIILLFPLIIDGSLQTFLGIESNNLRRIITGILFGISVPYIFFNIIRKIIHIEK